MHGAVRHARHAARGHLQTSAQRSELDFADIRRRLSRIGYGGDICLDDFGLVQESGEANGGGGLASLSFAIRPQNTVAGHQPGNRCAHAAGLGDGANKVQRPLPGNELA